MSFVISDEVLENDESVEIEVFVIEDNEPPLNSPKYNNQDVKNALGEISNGSSIAAASRKFNVPRRTLKRRLEGDPKPKGGKPPIMTAEEENKLSDWIIRSAKMGDCRTKEQVIHAANELLEIRGIQRENPLGEGWLKRFMKRHPNISDRTPQLVTRSSANVTEQDIRRFFEKFQTWLKEENYGEAFNDPRRILNSDETGFDLNSVPKKVLAGKGSSHVYSVERAPSKKRISVMYTFSADGKSYRPQLIVPSNSVKVGQMLIEVGGKLSIYLGD